MTTADGNPLTGDPESPEIRHLLTVIRPAEHREVSSASDECATDQCGGCTADQCVTRGREVSRA